MLRRIMKMTVYLPDDLASDVKQEPGLNVSGILQAALREEIARRRRQAASESGAESEMERHVVRASKSHGADVAFVGRLLDIVDYQVSIYRTSGQRIAIHDDEGQHLYVFDSFSDLVESGVADTNPQLLAEIAEKLGAKHVIELDI